MAKLSITEPYLAHKGIRAGKSISMGMTVYRAKRKGLLPKLARIIGNRFKIERLSNWGFEILPIIREDEFKRPIGIAIDEHTILIGGTLEWRE